MLGANIILLGATLIGKHTSDTQGRIPKEVDTWSKSEIVVSELCGIYIRDE